jgi:hypothetical protein
MGGKENPGGLEHDTQYTDGTKSIFCARDQVRRRKNTTIEKKSILRNNPGYFRRSSMSSDLTYVSGVCRLLYTIKEEGHMANASQEVSKTMGLL